MRRQWLPYSSINVNQRILTWIDQSIFKFLKILKKSSKNVKKRYGRQKNHYRVSCVYFWIKKSFWKWTNETRYYSSIFLKGTHQRSQVRIDYYRFDSALSITEINFKQFFFRVIRWKFVSKNLSQKPTFKTLLYAF